MNLRRRLLFGPLAAIILACGIIGWAFMVPGYSQVRQTVSEIGEVDSPARLPFTITLCCVAICILIFASAVRDISVTTGRSSFPSYLIVCMAISCAGVGIFAFPHPLHNVFGLSELIGYQAPLATALTWRRHPLAKTVVNFSWIMSAVLYCTIAINLVIFDRDGYLWAHIKPIYGIVQRALFAVWFIWCAGFAILLLRRHPSDIKTT